MSEKCAVILAGGRGTRLRPYTIAMPKPLVPVGEFPIMEIIIQQLVNNGFKKIILTVNHQADLIKAYFIDRKKWNIDISYSLEDKPLGTMGPLTLINDLPDNFLVMNGDILTDLKFSAFLQQHVEENNMFTISGYRRTHRVEYGVLYADDNKQLIDFKEKPELDYLVSMGVYAVSKDILKYIPKGEYYGFDTLMRDLIAKNMQVKIETYGGYWLDIGNPKDYEKANDDFESMRSNLLL